MVKSPPHGIHTATISLTIKNSVNAIEIKKTFDVQELFRMPGKDGKSTKHAEIKIGDSIIVKR